MAEENQDIFGKIDAMLGKRAGFVVGEARLDEAFPVLTEVVVENLAMAVEQAARHTDALTEPEASAMSPSLPAADHKPLSETDIDRLAVALEARLSELFIRQQLRIEALVRKVVREELDRRD